MVAVLTLNAPRLAASLLVSPLFAAPLLTASLLAVSPFTLRLLAPDVLPPLLLVAPLRLATAVFLLTPLRFPATPIVLTPAVRTSSLASAIGRMPCAAAAAGRLSATHARRGMYAVGLNKASPSPTSRTCRTFRRRIRQTIWLHEAMPLFSTTATCPRPSRLITAGTRLLSTSCTNVSVD